MYVYVCVCVCVENRGTVFIRNPAHLDTVGTYPPMGGEDRDDRENIFEKHIMSHAHTHAHLHNQLSSLYQRQALLHPGSKAKGYFEDDSISEMSRFFES